MSSFCLRLLSASLLLVALYGKPGPARAGDLEDCAGAVLEKSEPACTAILNQSSRAADDRLKAYVGRARVYLATARLDQALGDVDHAIEDFSRAIVQAGQVDRASYLARAQLFVAKGDYERAIADFDKLLSVAPDDKTLQQQRQAAIAMQTELAKVREGQPAA